MERVVEVGFVYILRTCLGRKFVVVAVSLILDLTPSFRFTVLWRECASIWCREISWHIISFFYFDY